MRCVQPAAVLLMIVLSVASAAAQSATELRAQATTAVNAGRHADAVAILNRYLAIRPDDASAWVSRAQSKINLKDADGALSDANRAILLDPSNAYAHFYRGASWQTKANFENAIADFSTTLLLDPQMIFAYNNRANCRQALNDIAGGIADYRKALEIDPTNTFAQDHLTALQLRTGTGAPPPMPTASQDAPLPAPPPLPPPPPLPAPPPLPPAAGGSDDVVPLRVGGAVPAPRLLQQVEPDYPDEARRAGVAGLVTLDVVIGTDGRVRQATVIRSIPALDAAALAAVRRWEYEPPRVNGRPEVVILTVTVVFK